MATEGCRRIGYKRCKYALPVGYMSKPSIALASVRILFVRLLLLSCWPFWNLARQGSNASPLRKCQQRVGMATRINYYSMIKWGSRRRSDGFTMGFLCFGKPREGKRNASYSIFTFWYWLPSGYVVTKVIPAPPSNKSKSVVVPGCSFHLTHTNFKEVFLSNKSGVCGERGARQLRNN
jgi:hypothetical protein